MASEDRSIIQILAILRRRFDNIYCHLQDLCMKYNRNVKHNETIKYLSECVGVCAVSYTHLDVYKRQVEHLRLELSEAELVKLSF